MKAKTVLIVVIVVLATALIVMNSEPVKLRFFLWPILSVPTFLFVPTTLLVGFLAGYLAAKLTRRSGK
jgi:uncharacterized integral membrane protein